MSFCLYWVVHICTNISSWQAYYQKLCTYYGLNRRTSTQLKLRSPKGEIDTDSVLNQLVQNLRQDIFLNKNSIQMFWYWYANFFFFIGMQISNFLTVLHLKETRIKTSIAVLKTNTKNYHYFCHTYHVWISYVLSKKDLNNQETTF